MKILIGMAVYVTNELHLDFTKQTIDSIKTKHDYKVILINNHCNDIYREDLSNLGRVIDTKKNCVGHAWNKIMEEGQMGGYDYILCPNNDIVFHPQAIDNLVNFAENHQEFIMWTANEHSSLRTLKAAELGSSFDEHPHFSCFMVKPEFSMLLFDKEKDSKEPYPGFFDENISPAYFEDSDMHNRILRAGYKAGKTADALFYHFGSRTIKSDEEIENKNVRTYEANREYLIKKWGIDFHGAMVENTDPRRFSPKGAFELA